MSDAPIRLGMLRLTDSAPLIVAEALGFFADEQLQVALSLEPSWANVADKLAHGLMEGASMLPPLAFAATLGLRGVSEPLIVPYMLSAGGNTITLEKGFGESLREAAREKGMAAALAERLAGDLPPLAVTHDYSTHHLLLRYWLASAGAEAGRDYQLTVAPPERMVDALKAGRIAGFCAGSPWGEIAARMGAGVTIATSQDVWRHAPEKALAMRERWAEKQPDAALRLLRALHRAGQFCEAPQNAAYVASLLARRAYLGLDSHALLASLPGTMGARATSRFSGGLTNFPWRSQALWFLQQMARWGQLPAGVDPRSAAERVYRPDLYIEALKPLGAPIPRSDRKVEGEHETPWRLPADPAPVDMAADIFCDGVKLNLF